MPQLTCEYAIHNFFNEERGGCRESIANDLILFHLFLYSSIHFFYFAFFVSFYGLDFSCCKNVRC